MVTLGWTLAGGFTPTMFVFMFIVGLGEGTGAASGR